jgi:hypothetical protein
MSWQYGLQGGVQGGMCGRCFVLPVRILETGHAGPNAGFTDCCGEMCVTAVLQLTRPPVLQREHVQDECVMQCREDEEATRVHVPLNVVGGSRYNVPGVRVASGKWSAAIHVDHATRVRRETISQYVHTMRAREPSGTIAPGVQS